MLYCFLYDLLRVLIEILIVRGRGDAQLRTEVVALRHQLGVLERQVGRPRWQPADRVLLATISRALPVVGCTYSSAMMGSGDRGERFESPEPA